MKRLARVEENTIAIDEERLYWKGVAEKLHETVDERERAIDWLDKRIKSAEEELAEKNRQVERLAATVNEYADENERLRQVAHQNAVAADGFAREVAAWKECESYQAQQRDILYAENVVLREKLDMTRFLLDAIRKNLTTAGPWTDWHTRIGLGRINAVLDATKE